MSKVATSSALGGGTSVAPTGAGARSTRRKQRCWIFHVAAITRDVKEADLLSSVRERYTTVKRLVVSPASADGSSITTSRNVLVEVQFTGPQPSEGPGALLRDLLCGSSVEAKPVELPRGRKKRARTDPTSSEASDSDIEDGTGARKLTSGRGSTTSLENVADEDEDESAGGSRCVTAKPGFNGKGGSPMFGGHGDEPGMHLTSGRDAGGPVAPSAGLEPLLSEALFKNAGPSVPSDACVVPVPGMRPQQHRVVSLESMPTLEHQRQHQQQHLVTAQQQQHQQPQQPFRMNGGQQWDDVVRGMTTPQGSGHSLDLGSVDLSSNGSRGSNSNAVKAEFEPLLAPTNSGGNWNSNDSGGALLGPMPPPQQVQPPLRGWSFDSAQIGDASQFSSGNMVMDLSDMDNLFRSTEGEAGGTAGNGSHGSSGSSADAGAGARQHQQDVYVPSKWPVPEGVLPLEKVIIEPSRKECDFEGRPAPVANTVSSRASGAPPPRSQCHLVFTGLDRTGVDVRNLSVTAHFGVDSVHKVGKAASPIQVGAGGRSYAAILYPSMQEVWPELYRTPNIRVVEVDVVVEIVSEDGEFQYVGPQLKVTYLRSPQSADDIERGTTGRRTSPARPPVMGPTLSMDDSPQVSYSCVDYSCGDWFAEMCQSVFRSGATSHHALPDDPQDLMSVDA